MELISGESIRAIPLNTLIVNANTDDRTQIIEAVHWVMDHIKTHTNVHAIFREVDELNFVTPNEIYIPAYVLRTRKELHKWASEYKKNSPEANSSLVPIMIVDSKLYDNKEDAALLQKLSFGIYIEKINPFFCCGSATYKKKTVNNDFLTSILSCVDEFTTQNGVIMIPTLLNESQKDPDYIDMLKNVKKIENEKGMNSPKSQKRDSIKNVMTFGDAISKQEHADPSHFGTVRLVQRV